MTSQDILALERRILKEEQALCGEIDACKRRHREQQAGGPRSHELEDVRRELRRWAREVDGRAPRRCAHPRRRPWASPWSTGDSSDYLSCCASCGAVLRDPPTIGALDP